MGGFWMLTLCLTVWQVGRMGRRFYEGSGQYGNVGRM